MNSSCIKKVKELNWTRNLNIMVANRHTSLLGADNERKMKDFEDKKIITWINEITRNSTDSKENQITS
jgi:hypothetical protein